MSKLEFKTVHDNEFSTPQYLYDALNREFNFTWDLACTQENKKAPNGLSAPKFNSLKEDWHKLDGWLWLNPPYSPLKPWIQKAQRESLLGAKIVVLMPSIISTRYFSEIPAAQIRFIVGRISFYRNGQEMRGNTKDNCLVIYGPPMKTDVLYVDRDSFKINPR